MEIIYAQEKPPNGYAKSIFLAGPTPRSKKTKSWRPDALKIFEELAYGGVIFVPELRGGEWQNDYSYASQIEWEEKCLNLADCILFWVPRNLKTMPAFTTNIEWGVWQNSGKVVFGAPPKAPKVDYQRYYAEKLGVPMALTLEETISHALKVVGDGAWRVGGEREVPLHIWRTRHFQQWYQAQVLAGNRLDGAKVEWIFRVGPNKNFIFIWVLHVDVYIGRENRHKINEVVIARPDLATIVMYCRGETLDDADVVLVREFRSPVANDDGFVWEAPSGSAKVQKDPIIMAADECSEETGLRIDPQRIRRHEARQLAATLSAHKSHLFSVEITSAELAYLKSQHGIPHGVLEDSERTYVEIMKLGDIRRQNNVDWSMLGMILATLSRA